MRKTLFRVVAALLTSTCMGMGFGFGVGTAMAADSADASPPSISWLQQARKSIYAKNYDEAIATLTKADATQSADWHNLMGFSFRKKTPPDLIAAEKHYQSALEKEPKHRGALEYYGELLLLKKDLKGAQALLARLDKACSFGCEEYRDLKKSIQQYSAAQ